MANDNQHQADNSEVTGTDQPRSAGRRALLKGSATALPVILTLQSGAALARSSNLVSAAHPSVRDRNGRALCLDTDSVNPVQRGRDVYDMGEPAYAHVNRIRGRDYRAQPSRRAQRISQDDMCIAGKPGYYKTNRRGKWKKVHTRGVIVSATAMRSFSGHVKYTEV